jgi:futalosine hydrolase
MTASESTGVRTLVLCPTEMERRLLEESAPLANGARLELCGVGPIVAAARAASLVAELRPLRVVLVGIAGTYDATRLPPGTAVEFNEVAVDGIGVGEGAQFLAPAAVGFPQWPGVPSRTDPIVDRLGLDGTTASRLLVTACAAASDPQHAAMRRARFPEAAAEDMEGFGVAAACALAGIPLRIVRGISNVVGDRTVANWCIPAAMHAVRLQLDAVLSSDSGWRHT